MSKKFINDYIHPYPDPTCSNDLWFTYCAYETKKTHEQFFFDEFLDIRNFYGNQNIFVQMQYLRLQMQACLLKSVEDIF